MYGGTINGVFGWEMTANVPIILQIPNAGGMYCFYNQVEYQ
jgi:hypothetical protein